MQVNVAFLGLQPRHLNDPGWNDCSFEDYLVLADAAADERVVAQAELNASIREFADGSRIRLTLRVLGAFEQKFDTGTMRDDNDFRGRISVQMVPDVAHSAARLSQTFRQVVDHLYRAIGRNGSAEKNDSEYKQQGANCSHFVSLIAFWQARAWQVS